jgi:hypothetical protein
MAFSKRPPGNARVVVGGVWFEVRWWRSVTVGGGGCRDGGRDGGQPGGSSGGGGGCSGRVVVVVRCGGGCGGVVVVVVAVICGVHSA